MRTTSIGNYATRHSPSADKSCNEIATIDGGVRDGHPPEKSRDLVTRRRWGRQRSAEPGNFTSRMVKQHGKATERKVGEWRTWSSNKGRLYWWLRFCAGVS